ncbi:MAG: Na/Pi cotransporter family protein [Calothrix sp. SM1_5_4]|nr:Na/Pi cotransporter family protein [Calothrix sp. SM1_5_4]
MSALDSIVFAVASVTLFLYGLQSFSREVQQLSDGPLRKSLAHATRNRFVGALSGAMTTAVLQSSSAVSALAIALTNSKILTLQSVLPVLIGANVGTASTAFLVSWKAHGLGAYFLLLGSVLSLLPIKVRVLGKSIFYFGFILFALDQINGALRPFFNQPFVIEWLSLADSTIVGISVGLILTAILQSSSVLTGITVILADQGLLTLPGAVAVVLGANIGTTATALVASLAMGTIARTAALANLGFNFVGVVLAYFFVSPLSSLASELGNGSVGMSVAYAHLIFQFSRRDYFSRAADPHT